MLIRRSLERDGNTLPRAWNALAVIPDEYSYHLHHGKRHPVSTYSISLRSITAQWLNVFSKLDALSREHNWEGTEASYPVLIAEYKELLYSLNEHFDACFSVLRSLCPPTAAPANLFDSQFLDKAKLPGWKKFRDSIKIYRDAHIGKLVNTLKHSQGELCSIFFYSTTEFRPGYYLRDVHPDGALGPSHKLHQNANTAFSFSRDMMIHFWWLFRTGDLLANTVGGALRTLHGVQVVDRHQDAPDMGWEKLITECARLRPEFFPDEVEKPYPRILHHADNRSLSIEFPSAARSHRVSPMRVQTQLTFDKNHPLNKLPYFGENGT